MQAQFKGAAQRMDGWYELGLFIAWHCAMWTRGKELPSWDSVRARFEKKKERQIAKAGTGQQDWREVRAHMAALRAQQDADQSRKGKPKSASPTRRRK